MKENDKIYKNSLTGLIEFCKDFEIIYHVMSLDKIAIYFNFLINMPQDQITKNSEHPLIFEKSKDLGSVFTISKFSGFLVHASLISFEKNSKCIDNLVKRKTENLEIGFNLDNLGNSEKLILFLDKLDSCEGIKSLEKKITKCYNSKISLVPPKEIISKVKFLLKFS